MHSLFTIQLMLPRLIWQAQASHLQSSFRWSRIYKGFQNHQQGARAKCLLWSEPGLMVAFSPINWSFFPRVNRIEWSVKVFSSLLSFSEGGFICKALCYCSSTTERCSRILEQTCMIQMGAFISVWLVLTEIKECKGLDELERRPQTNDNWDNGLVLGV